MTQGYWKNHANKWLVSTLTLGSRSYTETELLAILNSSVVGDASIILAEQLIAAKLNIANGTDGTSISGAIAQADSLLAPFSGKLPYNVAPSSSIGQQMVAVADQLDRYNNSCSPSTPPQTQTATVSQTPPIGSTRTPIRTATSNPGNAEGVMGSGTTPATPASGGVSDSRTEGEPQAEFPPVHGTQPSVRILPATGGGLVDDSTLAVLAALGAIAASVGAGWIFGRWWRRQDR